MITRVAIQYNGKEYVGELGWRHCDLIKSHWENGNLTLYSGTMGFIDDKGNFLDRKQAAEHAKDYKQVKRKIDLLRSEDLW